MPDPFVSAMGIAASGMRAQSTRIRVVAENVANADTPGYRRKEIAFEDLAAGEPGEPGKVTVKHVFNDPAPLERVYDPGHPLADAAGYVELSNVNPLIELADLQEAHRSYEAGLSAFEQARALYQRVLDILRR